VGREVAVSTNPDAAQAYLNMHLALAIGKGVQLDATQTAAIFALITDHRHEIEELRDRLRDAQKERAAVVAWLREQAETGDPMRATGRRRMADHIERGEHRREEGA
jgi:hypothetical protein